MPLPFNLLFPFAVADFRRRRKYAFVGLLMAVVTAAHGAAATTQPSFQVDVPYPTTDKPQSKLWFSHDAWWALLPAKSGPTLWQRTFQGWREQASVRDQLRGKPGRADVWFDRDGATAATVAQNTLAVLRLTPAGSSAPNWSASCLAEWRVPSTEPIETVTIARDGAGRWWIAAPVMGTKNPGTAPAKKAGVPRNVLVWTSMDAVTWQQLEPLASGISADDICAITAAPGGVAVIWSDQIRDTVTARHHRDARAPALWEEPEIIAAGGKTADDHLHAALSSNGTLWVATKNSVDKTGMPQLVLRVRTPAGKWQNLSYAPRETGLEPSRPVVIATPDAGTMLLGHTVYDIRQRDQGRIVFGRVEIEDAGVIQGALPVIAPDPALHSRINDITAPKAAFPPNAPWIVLASDAAGRVFEADLRALRPPR